MKSRKIIYLLGMVLTVMANINCNNSADTNKTNLGCTQEQYEVNIQNSLISAGSQAYLDGVTKNLISKLQNGEKVYVAALGGSVTEGAGAEEDKVYTKGYAYQFVDMLKAQYTKADIQFAGAGLSGTPPLLGVIRYQKDVVARLNHTPDLLILEFSVNDDGSQPGVRAYEGIIRNVLTENPQTTIISLYSDAKTYENCQGAFDPIAEHYGLPRISIQNAVENPSSNIDEAKFFFDYVHPTTAGHTFMAKCLMNVISLLDENASVKSGVEEASSADEATYILPAPKNENCFYNLHPLYSNTAADDENVTITAGNFSDKDSNSQSLKIGGTEFPDNWHHTRGTEAFKMTLNCKSLIFVYKHQGSWLEAKEAFGKAEVYVDDKKVNSSQDGTASFDGAKDGGWNDCVQEIIIDEASTGIHTVEVKMFAGDENKGFTILAFGYTK